MIELIDVTKRFKQVIALDDCNLKIEDKDMVAVIGADGSGKTTALKLIAGLLKPDSGTITINGDLPYNQRMYSGYMAQAFSWYKNLTVMENVILSAKMHGMNSHIALDESKKILQFVGLWQFKHRLAGKLSGGMKQKLALAAAVVYKPMILLLDEPSTGVDPVSRQELWELFQKINAEGTTIIVTTPYFDEANYCKHIVLMDRGKIILQDSLKHLITQNPDLNLETLFLSLTADEV